MSVKCIISRFAVLVPLLALGFAARTASAQGDEANASNVKFTVLYRFSNTDGAYPRTGLVQGTNGDFYGTTQLGGANCAPNGCGTIFKVTPTGTLTTLYNFCSQTRCADGEYPNSLIQASNGDFYGTTGGRGTNCAPYRCGTVFKMTPSGTLTTLYSFCAQSGCADGTNPVGLIQAANGDFYGTTENGGMGANGTVFKITATGALTTLYNFCSQTGCADGAQPRAGLIQGTDGSFYGTTFYGGINGNGGVFGSCGSGCGTIFKITPSGNLTRIYAFCSQPAVGYCPDGVNPSAGVTPATNGDLYSTASTGAGYFAGTVVSVTHDGALNGFYDFCSNNSCPYGEKPYPGLIQAASGNLYGTATLGGLSKANCYYSSCGTIYKMTPDGTFTLLYSFCAQPVCADGDEPNGLIQATDGNFYGTTLSGGAEANCPFRSGCGTIFALSTGQAPFVETRPTAGMVGAAVTILGNSFAGATSVSFNGTPAAFTVVSAREISTTVPAGATTGKVQVTATGRTLTSNAAFEIP